MNKAYCDRFDVHFDMDTGKYLEPKCKDNNCEYCSKRPKDLNSFCKTCKWELHGGIICPILKNKEE